MYINQLQATADVADLTSENYFALDGIGGSKKVPADMVKLQQVNPAVDTQAAIYDKINGHAGGVVVAIPSVGSSVEVEMYQLVHAKTEGGVFTARFETTSGGLIKVATCVLNDITASTLGAWTYDTQSTVDGLPGIMNGLPKSSDPHAGTLLQKVGNEIKELGGNALAKASAGTDQIHNLTQTATEADLKAGNYFALDGAEGTKRLPAELVTKSQMNRELHDNGFNQLDVTIVSPDRPWCLNETFNGTIHKINFIVPPSARIKLVKCNGVSVNVIAEIVNNDSAIKNVEYNEEITMSEGDYIGLLNESGYGFFSTGGSSYTKGNTRVFRADGRFVEVTAKWSVPLIIDATILDDFKSIDGILSSEIIKNRDAKTIVSVKKSLHDSGFVIGKASISSVQRTPWCIDEKVDGVITSIDAYVCAGSTIDVVTCNGVGILILGSLTNNGAADGWMTLTPNIKVDGYVGYMSHDDQSNIYLVGSPSYSNGHTRTYRANGSFNTNTNKWSIGLRIEYVAIKDADEIVRELSAADDVYSISLADYTIIPIYGQSLSIGSQSTPAISVVPAKMAGLMLGDKVWQKQLSAEDVALMDLYELREDGEETLASGLLETLLHLIQQNIGVSKISKFWKGKKFVFVACGDGSKTIEQLTELGSGDVSYYDGLINVINGIAAKVTSLGKTVNIPAFIWIQGEQNQKQNYVAGHDLYKNALAELQQSINNVSKNSTGQSNDVVCLCYQSCAQGYLSSSVSSMRTITYSNAKRLMGVPSAQMELIRDNDNFAAIVPSYVLEHHIDDNIGANIHLTNIGEKQLGAYCAVSLYDVLFNKTKKKGIVPKCYSVDGNKIIIEYISATQLQLDVFFVKDDGCHGFKVLNQSDANIISSVSVFDRSVEITCNSSPVGCILSYGENWSVGYDGRIAGSRGNISNVAGADIAISILGNKYVLNDYAYCFACDVIDGQNIEIQYTSATN